MPIENPILAALQAQFDGLDDPRRAQGKRHRQGFVLLLVLLATMSGYFGYRALEDFLDKHRAALIVLFQPEKDRIPSYSTVRRVLMQLDFVQFTQIYKQWMAQYLPPAPVEEPAQQDWAGIDGKTLRGSALKDAYVHLVSIFSTFDNRVLDLGKVQHKSNEIPLVQQMIAASDLNGVIFTLDALHCQKKRRISSSPATITT